MQLIEGQENTFLMTKSKELNQSFVDRETRFPLQLTI